MLFCLEKKIKINSYVGTVFYSLTPLLSLMWRINISITVSDFVISAAVVLLETVTSGAPVFDYVTFCLLAVVLKGCC